MDTFPFVIPLSVPVAALIAVLASLVLAKVVRPIINRLPGGADTDPRSNAYLQIAYGLLIFVGLVLACLQQKVWSTDPALIAGLILQALGTEYLGGLSYDKLKDAWKKGLDTVDQSAGTTTTATAITALSRRGETPLPAAPVGGAVAVPFIVRTPDGQVNGGMTIPFTNPLPDGTVISSNVTTPGPTEAIATSISQVHGG